MRRLKQVLLLLVSLFLGYALLCILHGSWERPHSLAPGEEPSQEPPQPPSSQHSHPLPPHQPTRQPEPSRRTPQEKPSLQTEAGRLLHRWKLYGGASNDSGERREKRTARLFSNSLQDEPVRNLVEQLEALQISCSERPESDQTSLEEAYGKFLQVLANYTPFHARERERDSAKILVWICHNDGCGGLADRVRGLSYTLLLAVMSRRVLLFDWQDSRISRKTYLLPNAIDWHLTEKEKERVFQKTNYVKADQSPGNGSVTFLRIFTAMGHRGIDADIPLKKLKLHLGAVASGRPWVGLETNMLPSSLVLNKNTASLEWLKRGVAALGLDKLPQLKIDSVVGLVFRYLFRFSPEIVREMDEARQMLRLTNLTYVGLHIRTGFIGSKYKQDGIHPKLYRNPSQWQALMKCAHNYAAEHGSIVFLATDSSQAKDMALQMYRGQMRTLNDSVIHIDKLWLSPEKVGDFEREGVLSMWVELVLLAESHSVVMGESGFPFLAKNLCLIPRARTLNGVTCKPVQFLERA